MIRFVIPGEPIAKKRARFSSKGKFAYNDQETDESKFMNQIQFQIEKIKDFSVIDYPFVARMVFLKSRPKNHYGIGKNENKLKASSPRWITSKPDLDNAEKFVLDCLKGIVIKDDSLLSLACSVKVYGEPKTMICLQSMDEFIKQNPNIFIWMLGQDISDEYIGYDL